MGWSRIFFGTFGTFGRLLASLVLLVVMGFAPSVAAVVGFGLAAAGVAPAGWWLACGLAGAFGVAMQLTVMYRFYKLAGARGELAWSYLVGYFITMITLVMAMLKLRPGAKVTWRNTSYSAPVSDG